MRASTRWARAGISFRPVEGNTGTNAADVFVRQDGGTWYVAVFNYNTFGVIKGVNLARLGISGTYTAVDLWSGASTAVSRTTWNVNLGSAAGKTVPAGFGRHERRRAIDAGGMGRSFGTLSTVARNAAVHLRMEQKRDNNRRCERQCNYVHPVNANNAGLYQVAVAGRERSVTNTALLTLLESHEPLAQMSDGGLPLSWPIAYTGWRSRPRPATRLRAWARIGLMRPDRTGRTYGRFN